VLLLTPSREPARSASSLLQTFGGACNPYKPGLLECVAQISRCVVGSQDAQQFREARSRRFRPHMTIVGGAHASEMCNQPKHSDCAPADSVFPDLVEVVAVKRMLLNEGLSAGSV
jgi:hypothetical protein